MTEALRVPDTELVYDSDQVFRWRGQPFSGIAYAEMPVRSEVTYVDGHQTGVARDFYSSGQVSAEAWYYEGVLHGWSRSYDEHGQVITETLHEFGMPVSSDGRAVEPPHQALLERYRVERMDWPPAL